MAASGVMVDDECVTVFKRMKEKPKDLRFIIFTMNEKDDTIIVETLKEKTADEMQKDVSDEDKKEAYEEFRSVLIEKMGQKDCCYAMYDFPHGNNPKIVFFVWCPDESKVKKKMMYASSKDTLKRKLNFLGVEVQGNDVDEITWEEVYTKASKGQVQ